MKKLFVISFILVCLTSVLIAQSSSRRSKSKVAIGVMGGLNIPRLSSSNDNEMSRDFTSRSGEAFGLNVSLDLGSNFALRADVLYSSEGGKRDGIQAIDASTFVDGIPAGTYFYANYKNECILNYAEIPVIVKYSFPMRNSLKFYVDFGPYVGFLLKAEQKTGGESPIYADRAEKMTVIYSAQSFNATTDIKDSTNPVNFGLTGGVGLSHGLGFGEIFLDVRGAYGLTVIQKDKQNGSSHNGNLLIGLGYSIPL